MQQDQQVATSPEQTAQFQPQLEKAKDFIGAKVVNERGEQLGKIEDVVLTPDHQGVNYIVLSHGGVWGMADKFFAIPGYQFSPGSVENGKTFILKGVSKANLDQAPGFDKKHWPAMANENWLGTERSSAMAPSSGMMPQGSASMPAPAEQGTSRHPMYGMAQPTDIQHLRLSKLFGTTVRDAQNENIGRLDNAMIDTNQGKLAYGIVAARHGTLGTGKDFVAVPWSALDWTSQPGIAKVNVDWQTLASLAFSRDNFPNFADPQYSRQLFERFRAMPYWESPSLGFIPGQEKESGNLPSSGMTPPDSGMAAPNTTAPNSAAPRMINYDHKDKHASSYRYNPNTVETIHGTVTKVATHRMKDTATEELALTVKADNGKTVRVFVGPRSFVDRQNIIFRVGDPVTITGSLVKAHGHDVLVASQIQTSNRTLDLRTREGAPLWSREQARAYGPNDRSYDQYGYPYRY
jgi:sporulation protein YlmC with PRC-barrel domain